VTDRRTVRDTWETIGHHFAETRPTPWPEVERFCRAQDGAVGLDVGTGNGRHAAVLADSVETVIGLDVSAALLAVATRRLGDRVAAMLGDATRLPIRSATVDVALAIATIHHLPTATTRRASLAELARVLTPGGRALVSVWSTAHDRFDGDTGFDTTVAWTLPSGDTVPRYYHIYAPEEFRTVLADSPLTVHAFKVSSGNCYATVGPACD